MFTGTVFPLLVQALQDKQLTVGEPYFVKMGVPIGLALLFLMAVGPALPWRAASGEVLRAPAADPGVGGRHHARRRALSAARAGIANVLAFALGAFTLASVARSVVVGVRARVRAHVGARAGRDRAYGAEQPAPLRRAARARGRRRARGRPRPHRRATRPSARSGSRPAQSATVRGFTVTFLRHAGRGVGAEDDGDAPTFGSGAARRISASYSPGDLVVSRTSPTASARRSVHTDPWHDVYLTLVSAPRDGSAAGAITLGVQVGTLVMWLWVGGAIMGLGTLVALTPTRRRRPIVAEPARRDR